MSDSLFICVRNSNQIQMFIPTIVSIEVAAAVFLEGN